MLIPNAECVVALDAGQQSLQAPFFVTVDEDFGVGMVGTKAVTGRDKLRPQISMVVDFTIERDDYVSIFIAHRLTGGNAYIDDGQTAVSEAYLAITRYPRVVTVRTAMGHCIAHASDDAVIHQPVTVERKNSYNSAHWKELRSFLAFSSLTSRVVVRL